MKEKVLTQKQKEQIEKTMKIMDCSYEDALDSVLYDEMVDKNEKNLEYDLTKEQEKISKQARQCEHTNKQDKPKVKRERKVDTLKLDLIQKLGAFLQGDVEITNIEIVNQERQISFEIQGEKFDLTLVKKRAKK